ncbi:MAG: hypothetical protein S0880_32045, partial [Actinomycetota bacterium]|nr:hypothetical protein [Actinomycetota bacterium]
GVALAAAVMVKTWPALLVPPLLASGRWRAAVWSVAATGAAVVAWAVWAGVDGPLQVLSFRGATGWHVESTGGIVTVLWSGADAALEAGAYRVGSAPLAAKAVGALAVVAVTSAACVGVWLRSGEQAADGADEPAPGATAELAALASIAALLVASPLLSPQFLVWLTPWAAVAAAAGHRRIALVVAAACALTQVTLVAFSPAGLDATAPALLLGVRNALLGAAALSSVRILLAPRRATASDHQPAVTPGG